MKRLPILTVVAAGLWIAVCSGRTAAVEEPKKDGNPRQAVESFLATAAAGKLEEAAKWTEPGHVSAKQLRELNEVLRGKKVLLEGVHGSERGKRALAITGEVRLPRANPDGRDRGKLVITLNRVEGRWLVRDVDFAPGDSAKEKEKRFLKRFPDARPVPEKSRR